MHAQTSIVDSIDQPNLVNTLDEEGLFLKILLDANGSFKLTQENKIELKSLYQLNDMEFDFIPDEKLLLSSMNDHLENGNISNRLSLYFMWVLIENGSKNIDLNVTNNLCQYFNYFNEYFIMESHY